MNALSPIRVLKVTENGQSSALDVAVLGRDIRASPETIARYCVMAHEPIYEDLATLVESMAYWDRLMVRRRASGWPRQMSIELPVYEWAQFQRPSAVAALTDAAHFLTGDQWHFEFVARRFSPPARQGHLTLPQIPMKHVVPFSDGLDSFAQAQLSIQEHGRDAVMLVRSGLGRDRVLPHVLSLRVPRKFGGIRMREVSYRTRPLVFYTSAAIAAAITRAESVVIGENGQGAIGPACLPFADEWWFRSAHPAFVKLWAHFLSVVLETAIRFEQPQVWKTKGEVLSTLRALDLLTGWQSTSSCATRPTGRYGHHGCGVCGGCLLRTVSVHAAGLSQDRGTNAFDVCALEDKVRRQDGQDQSMTPGERAVAVRAIAAMAEFASLVDLPEGRSAVDREARLIDPDHPENARVGLVRLLQRHQLEWSSFIDALPKQSWVRQIVGQL